MLAIRCIRFSSVSTILPLLSLCWFRNSRCITTVSQPLSQRCNVAYTSVGFKILRFLVYLGRRRLTADCMNATCYTTLFFDSFLQLHSSCEMAKRHVTSLGNIVPLYVSVATVKTDNSGCRLAVAYCIHKSVTVKYRKLAVYHSCICGENVSYRFNKYRTTLMGVLVYSSTQNVQISVVIKWNSCS